MAEPLTFAKGVEGLPLSGSDYNNNWAMTEESLIGVSCYLVTGLLVTAGSGLSVQVSAGTAVLGAMQHFNAFAIGTLEPSATVHLYIQQDGSGAHNVTGISPPNSLKLGTCDTGVATVNTVNMGRTSGRQQFQQPQNLVHGGPSAGTASAGHPRAVNLAQWNATQAEGFEVFGTLPAGATSAGAVILAPNTPTRNTIQPTAAANPGLIVNNHLGTAMVSVNESAIDSTLVINSPDDNPTLALKLPSAATQPFLLATLGSDGKFRFNSDASYDIFGTSDLGSVSLFTLVPSLTDAVHTHTKSKVIFQTYDGNFGANTRQNLSIESDGASALTHILGSLSLPEVATSSNTTLNGSHFSIFEDTTGGNKTVTLPTAVGIAGRIYAIKNTGTGANTLTIATTSAQTIDGAAGASTSTPQACLILQSDGANWQTLSSN